MISAALVIEQFNTCACMEYSLKATLCPHVLPSLTGCADSAESSCGDDDSSEDCWESGSEASDGSLYLPHPNVGWWVV